MLTALDLPIETLNPADRNFVAMVREHGWMHTPVNSNPPRRDFSYTTGFWLSAGHPELIIFTSEDSVAHKVFWELFREAKAGRPLLIGQPTDQVFNNFSVYAFPVAKRFYPDYFGFSHWFYACEDNYPVLQIVWPDLDGVFPWEPGFAQTFAGHQPDLSEHGWGALNPR